MSTTVTGTEVVTSGKAVITITVATVNSDGSTSTTVSSSSPQTRAQILNQKSQQEAQAVVNAARLTAFNAALADTALV